MSIPTSVLFIGAGSNPASSFFEHPLRAAFFEHLAHLKPTSDSTDCTLTFSCVPKIVSARNLDFYSRISVADAFQCLQAHLRPSSESIDCTLTFSCVPKIASARILVFSSQRPIADAFRPSMAPLTGSRYSAGRTFAAKIG